MDWAEHVHRGMLAGLTGVIVGGTSQTNRWESLMLTDNAASPTADPAAAARGLWRIRLELFAIAFVALFLELMVIRWAPSVVRMVAYYANLMLISSFLGLGIGALLTRRMRSLLPSFAVLLALNVAFLLLARQIALPSSTDEARFYISAIQGINYLTLGGVFFFNAAVFVPLGQRLGTLFESMPVLQAYAWDLGGSLTGTLAFGLFSLTRFSPVFGMAAVMLIFLALAPRRSLAWIAPLLALTLCGVWLSNDRHAIWSPYYYIAIRDAASATEINERSPALSEPLPNIRTMLDPPTYVVSVNHDFYQPNRTLDLSRFSAARLPQVRLDRLQYDLPYAIAPKHDRVLVLGAGGGTDTEVALLNGAKHVDAVEIDPVLVRLSRKFNPSGIYDDPRVQVHVDDARAYIQRTTDTYDMVVFGWLDSQALFSQMSNLRLDGYIYTVESIRQAYSLLGEDGTLSLSFMASRPWLATKLHAMVREATGREPIVYHSAGQVIFCVPSGQQSHIPEEFGRFARLNVRPDFDWSQVDLPTDDWPYLYLRARTIPADYLGVISVLLAASVGLLLWIRGGRLAATEGHFLLMGVGFLLLQTKSIGDCSLYFGTTWVVTMIIIAGVLLMVLAANLLALKLPRFSPWLYAPLFASLLVLYLVPRHVILAEPFALRVAWSLLVVPLPIFFAGLIFSTTFRAASSPSMLLGANLVGAMIGGFCEYLGMVIGHDALTLLVLLAYLGSLLVIFAARRGALGGGVAVGAVR